MAHASIDHPTRGTLEFKQAQTDADSRQAKTNIARGIGTERTPLVHIATRDRTRTINGRVTAPRRADNDPNTSDWRQALANYIDTVESHLDEFQGAGTNAYTFTDDIRSTSFNVVFESVEWTLTAGRPYDFEYEISLIIGRGVMEDRPRDPRNPTVDTSMDVAAKVGGFDLPGLRELRSTREVEFDAKAIYDKTTAENNDVVVTDGTQQTLVFRGTHTGTDSQRASADSDLEGLIGSGQVTFETAWPGYDLDGFVVGYDSDLEARFGDEMHHFTLTFVEGEPA